MNTNTLLFIFLCLLDTVLCGSYCYDNGYTFYCDYDCCGDYGDEYCCGVYSWIVVVAVLGGIALITVAVIIFIYVKKKKTRQGRVINNTGQQPVQTTVIHAPPAYQTHPPPYQQPAPGYMPQQQGVYPPPAPMNYGADPAYPPPGR